MSAFQDARRVEMEAKNKLFMEGYHYALERVSVGMISGDAKRACVALDFAGLYLEPKYRQFDCEAAWTDYADRIGVGNWQSYADCQLVRFRQLVTG